MSLTYPYIYSTLAEETSPVHIYYVTPAHSRFIRPFGGQGGDEGGRTRMPLIVSRINRWSRENTITKYIFMLVAGMLLTSTLLTSCVIPITYHDTTTYKNLTDLKAETMMLFETFDTKPYVRNEAALVDLALKFRKAYEYEKGKGQPNSKTMQQFNEIQKLLNADVADYQENRGAKLGPKYFQQAAVVLGQAFDIAIATENLKNKDK